MNSTTRPLSGVRVLVTRPAAQAQSLIQRVEQAGGTAVHFPTLEIVAVHDDTELKRVLADVVHFDYAIFISPNAVVHGLAHLKMHGDLPARLTVAAIGRGTARALTETGIVNPITPMDGSNSEALLALPSLMNVSGKRVVIFRGEGGRALLGDTLRARGAQVEYAECYRRVRPDTDAAPLSARLRANDIDIVTVTSVESLRNLHDMLDTAARACLHRLPMVVVGVRQAEACQALGIQTRPWIARDAGDDSIVAAIQAWRASKNSL
jgi:uroporphyrinogen-III synthase